MTGSSFTLPFWTLLRVSPAFQLYIFSGLHETGVEHQQPERMVRTPKDGIVYLWR